MEFEITSLKQSHQEKIFSLKEEHELEISRLREDFKNELVLQKNEWETKLTELRIDFEQESQMIQNEMKASIVGSRTNNPESSSQSQNDSSAPEYIDSKPGPSTKDTQKEQISDQEKKYADILEELKQRRMSLEEDLNELKVHEQAVKKLRNEQEIENIGKSCPSAECLHERKYNKIKNKYLHLVTRIKHEKAKKKNKYLPKNHSDKRIETDSSSISQDKSSIDDQINVSNYMTKTDDTPSASSVSKHIYENCHRKDNNDSDEDLQLSYEDIDPTYDKFSSKMINHRSQNTSRKHSFKHIPFTSTPKKAWEEDPLLKKGKKVLAETQKILNSSHVLHNESYKELDLENFTPEEIRNEITKQDKYYAESKLSKVNRFIQHFDNILF